MSRRTAGPARAAVLLSVPLSWLLLAGPAFADSNNDQLQLREGEDAHAQVTTAEAVLLYLVVPLVLMAVISALVWLPGVVRGQRYRPQRGGWAAAPVWFAGPPDPAAAVEGVQTDSMSRGGARGSW